MQAKGRDDSNIPSSPFRRRGSILEAVRLMLQHQISGLPVLDEFLGNLAGIVSEGDLLRRVGNRHLASASALDRIALSVRASWQMNTSMQVHAR